MYLRALLVFALLIPFHALSLNFSSTFLRLNCPQRGLVEVILHVYDHTQERWRGHFETGAGHKRAGDTEMIPFANGDILFHCGEVINSARFEEGRKIGESLILRAVEGLGPFCTAWRKMQIYE